MLGAGAGLAEPPRLGMGLLQDLLRPRGIALPLLYGGAALKGDQFPNHFQHLLQGHAVIRQYPGGNPGPLLNQAHQHMLRPHISLLQGMRAPLCIFQRGLCLFRKM